MVRALLGDKALDRIAVVDTLSSGAIELLPKSPRIDLYLRDVRSLRLSDIGSPRVVFYLCASPFVPASWQDPASTFDVNVHALEEFLDRNAVAESFKLVYASSGEVYGEVNDRAREDQAFPPSLLLSPYAQSRIAAERLLFEFSQRYGLSSVILRLFNVIGPRATQPYFVPEMIRQIAHGGVIKHGNLDSVRDFVWIGDTVDAFVAASRLHLDDPFAVNVASGIAWTMSDILHTLLDLSGSLGQRLELDSNRVRNPDLERLVGDPSLAQERLRWRSQVDVPNALSRTFGWYMRHGSWPYERRYRAGLLRPNRRG